MRKLQFKSNRPEDKKELYASHALDTLIEEVGPRFAIRPDAHKLAAVSCLLNTTAANIVGVPVEELMVDSKPIVDRSLDLVQSLLEKEGWSIPETLEILGFVTVLIAVNLYAWRKELDGD